MTTGKSKFQMGCRFNAALFFIAVLLQLLPCGNLFAVAVPALTGRVNDYASMISPGARADIEGKLKQFEQQESTQIVILTIPSLEGDPIEDFSIRVAEAWKIGRKGSDNGVLFIVSKNEHKVRIEVGYGLEGRMTDLLAGRIIRDEVAPSFKNGNFDEGFAKGVTAIMDAVRGEYKGKPQKENNDNAPSIPLLLFIMFVVYLLSHLFRRRGGGGFMGPGGMGGWYVGGPGGGGGSDGGGFSGGGGGFGGGGASGDW